MPEILLGSLFFNKSLVGSLDTTFAFAEGAGFDGLSVQPIRFRVTRELSRDTLDPRTKAGIKMFCQSTRSEKIGRQYWRKFKRHPSKAQVLIATAVVPEKAHSLELFLTFMGNGGLQIPTQIFPYDAWDGETQYPLFYNIEHRWLLAQPEILGHWEIQVGEFAERAANEGYNGLIINTKHTARPPDKSQGVSTYFPRWSITVPQLAKSGMVKCIQLRFETTDDIRAIRRGYVKEGETSELLYKVQILSEYVRPQFIEIQLPSEVLADYLGVWGPADDYEARLTYQDIVRVVRQMFN